MFCTTRVSLLPFNRIHPAGFPVGQEIEILLFVLFSIIYILTFVGQQCYYLCCVGGTSNLIIYVYFNSQLLIPGDLLHQFQCAQHAVQLPIRDQDHLLSGCILQFLTSSSLFCATRTLLFLAPYDRYICRPLNYPNHNDQESLWNPCVCFL